jgi:hypothetical protein
MYAKQFWRRQFSIVPSTERPGNRKFFSTGLKGIMLDHLVGIMRKNDIVVVDWLKTYYKIIEIPLKISVQGYSVAWLVDSIRLSDDAIDCFGIEHF